MITPRTTEFPSIPNLSSMGIADRYSEPVNLKKYVKATHKETRTTSIEDIDLITKFTDGTLTVDTTYGTMKIALTSTEEEIGKVVSVLEKKQVAYKYYSSVWFVSAVFLCFFVTSGIAGLIGPVSSITGSIFSCIGVIGAIIDWKDWSKKHANQSFR